MFGFGFPRLLVTAKTPTETQRVICKSKKIQVKLTVVTSSDCKIVNTNRVLVYTNNTENNNIINKISLYSTTKNCSVVAEN